MNILPDIIDDNIKIDMIEDYTKPQAELLYFKD